MNKAWNRRDFLKTSLTAGLGVAAAGLAAPRQALAIEPLKRSGQSKMTLSLVGYSFRKYFTEKDPAKKITLFDLVDFCADQGLSAAELTGYYFPKPVTEEYLAKLKHHLHLRGVHPSGTSVGNNFTLPKGPKRDEQIAMTKKFIDTAAFIGAPYVRVFGGAVKDMSIDEAKKNCIEGFEECADYAGTKGVFLGLENDQGITTEARDVLDMIKAVKSPWMGLNLDTGNYHTDDPYGDLVKCAPYAINVHCKTEMKPRNQERGPADLDRVLKILRDANYQGYIALEYEAAEDAYQAVPGWLKKLKEKVAA
ncbi:sugar phosphate isomerase/epimerase family protein [Pedosphaera parvula]|uniref:Xylose isomerase domain protein TIM barrel n=1 Tax=Pedosphaera parvula (strain Ellin514) TaxID=320771 RepID=B9XCX1_PEDPL|nr:sugar phosphate isomerase/epimerase family protein [Pedosphaera parvula]EEF62317.1 Xylose isomerase domain protein TIM barrel [Pedosphaera parvula Ellin514]